MTPLSASQLTWRDVFAILQEVAAPWFPIAGAMAAMAVGIAIWAIVFRRAK